MSWIGLAILTGGSWYIMSSFDFAWSVAAGGILANLSFLSTQRDVMDFMNSLDLPRPEDVAEGQGENETMTETTAMKQAKKIGKSKYIIKFWLRLALIGLVLLLLIKSGRANVFGLLLGLSTVVFTIILTTVSAAGRYFISGR
ncbi:MAG: ATP synthase subunit I [Desulfobulbaceae bacterium]|uniref:ATP synthase subunit I n=1 Tax=Candidatus Desulfatifera sulfidica TaxID=2841691 RepID=A0A8J6NC80_9BACT|nr:ATP synthase subunit I [Candidatus Desulfatifera sulfidica]